MDRRFFIMEWREWAPGPKRKRRQFQRGDTVKYLGIGDTGDVEYCIVIWEMYNSGRYVVIGVDGRQFEHSIRISKLRPTRCLLTERAELGPDHIGFYPADPLDRPSFVEFGIKRLGDIIPENV